MSVTQSPENRAWWLWKEAESEVRRLAALGQLEGYVRVKVNADADTRAKVVELLRKKVNPDG